MSHNLDKVNLALRGNNFIGHPLLHPEAMVYVDLNPILAGLAEMPEFTSISERIQFVAKQLKSQQTPKSKVIRNRSLK